MERQYLRCLICLALAWFLCIGAAKAQDTDRPPAPPTVPGDNVGNTTTNLDKPPAPPQSNQTSSAVVGASASDKPPTAQQHNKKAEPNPTAVGNSNEKPTAEVKPANGSGTGKGTASKQVKELLPETAPETKNANQQKELHAPSVSIKQSQDDKFAPEIKINIEPGTVILDTDPNDDVDDTPDPSSLPDVADIEKKLKSIPALPPNIKVYLEDKYVRLDDLPSVILQMTPYGQQIESIHMRGDITPKDEVKAAKFWKAKNEPSREEKARALARAFMEEEAGLLGIVDLKEMSEIKVETIENPIGLVTLLNYTRFIGQLELEKSYLQVDVGPDETIRYISAKVVHVTPELYHAVRKQKLTKKDVCHIVRQDVKGAMGPNRALTVFKDFKKVAIPKPPYVIWKGTAGTQNMPWIYKIDAFTGEILEKQDARQFFRQK